MLMSPPRAMPTAPFTNDRSLSSVHWVLPPVPSPFGSPPWMTKFATTRWNVSPSYRPLLARKAKFETVLGALSGRSWMTIVPPFASVIVAFVEAWSGAAGQSGVGVAVRTAATVRIGVGVGPAAVLPHAEAMKAPAANRAAILTRQ